MSKQTSNQVSTYDVQINALRAEIKGLESAKRAKDAGTVNDLSTVPAAACRCCGGWTGCGGMSQYRNSAERVLGRTGCYCFNSELRKALGL